MLPRAIEHKNHQILVISENVTYLRKTINGPKRVPQRSPLDFRIPEQCVTFEHTNALVFRFLFIIFKKFPP